MKISNLEEIKMEMLSKIDEEALANYIAKTSDELTSFDRSYIDITNLLDIWASKKAHIYLKMGRRLKLEREIKCSVSKAEMDKKIKEMKERFSDFNFILANSFLDSLDSNEITNNILDADKRVFDVVFKKGMRVSRCFKKLINGSKNVDSYQTELSMLIQSLKVKGHAVISIDPIDYLTMSVNNAGWTSCHRLSGGCYKAGCLAYMTDFSTAISYATNKNITAFKKYEGLEYANKLWRQCVHIGETKAIQARQYPAEYKSNMATVSEMLVDMMNNYKGVSTYIAVEREACSLYDHQENYGSSAYNDIEEESFSDGGALILESLDEEDDIQEIIRINSDVDCLHCGGELEDSDSLVCYDCK